MKKIFTTLLASICCLGVFGQQDNNPLSWTMGNTTAKIGGFVTLLGYYESGGSIATDPFVVSSIPVPGTWDQKGRLGFDASSSRLSLEVIRKTGEMGDLKVYVESDFCGAGSVLRLRQAYVSFLGIVAGQTWSFMVDLAASAPSTDLIGVNSRTFLRTPMIGYTRALGKGFTVGAAAEFPGGKTEVAEGGIRVNQRIPDVPVFMQYKAAGGHLRLSGVFRGLSYGNAETEKVKTLFGWGVQLSGSIKAARFMTFYAQGIYGNGIGRYLADLAPLSVDLIAGNSDDPGLKAVSMGGYSFGARADLSKKVYLGANFSQCYLDTGRRYIDGDDYRRGTYISGAVFWNLYRNLTVAAEYLDGRRQNADNASGHVGRTQLMIKYDF